jgi:hypothetical protein
VKPEPNRVVDAIVAACDACGCPGVPRIEIVRGFDRSSRQAARSLRQRLAVRGAGSVHELPVSLAPVSVPSDGHCCVVVDTTGRTAGARVAAFRRAPLVSLHDGDAVRLADGTGAAALRATFLSAEDGPWRPFPSAEEPLLAVALESFRVVPNQPEKGELLVAVDGAEHRLAPGSTVSVRALADALQVEAVAPGGRCQTWTADAVEIRQLAGLHPVYRDGVCICDLEDRLLVQHEPGALRRAG